MRETSVIYRRLLMLILLSALLAACAATPPRFEAEGVNTVLTPQTAVRQSAASLGQPVLWGGVIVNSSNLEEKTQFEVLGYPLNDKQRPDLDKPPSGRFLAVKPGYMETADYAPGRLITVKGRIKETASGKVGQADYRYPVVEIEDAQLWDRETARERNPRPRFNFGIGVMIGR